MGWAAECFGLERLIKWHRIGKSLHGKLLLGKWHRIGKLPPVKIPLGSCHLGKYPWEVATWEKAFEKLPNMIMYREWPELKVWKPIFSSLRNYSKNMEQDKGTLTTLFQKDGTQKKNAVNAAPIAINLCTYLPIRNT